jgi:hypothetical protein
MKVSGPTFVALVVAPVVVLAPLISYGHSVSIDRSITIDAFTASSQSAGRQSTWPQSTQTLELFSATIFQGASVQNFDRSLACQSNNAPLLKIRNSTTHCLDRDCEIFGDVIARDR